MRVMVLGYTEVGKTYYLASLDLLRYNQGQRGFSLQPPDITERGRTQGDYKAATGDQEQVSIISTMSPEDDTLVLKQGAKSIEYIGITDIKGQALPADGDPEEAKKILEELKEPGSQLNQQESNQQELDQYDGLILFLQTPGSELLGKVQTPSSDGLPGKPTSLNEQLLQMLQFTSELLNKSTKEDKQVPLTLVLNKIDALPQAQGIRDTIESAEASLRSQLEQNGIERSEITRTWSAQKGEVISNIIKPLIETDEVEDIMKTFFAWIRNSKFKIPNRVFPCTSFGFDNVETKEVSSGDEKFVPKRKNLEPYGSAASFLWTIYTSLKAKELRDGAAGDPQAEDKLLDELLDDIRELHTSGQAYYDDDDPVWDLRSISDLYAHTLEGAGYVTG